MQLIDHSSYLEIPPETAFKNYLIDRYNDLVETEDDLPVIFIIIEEDDDITGPDYAFVSDNGLLGDGGTLGLYEAVWVANS
jgi:hypothetical protein